MRSIYFLPVLVFIIGCGLITTKSSDINALLSFENFSFEVYDAHKEGLQHRNLHATKQVVALRNDDVIKRIPLYRHDTSRSMTIISDMRQFDQGFYLSSDSKTEFEILQDGKVIQDLSVPQNSPLICLKSLSNHVLIHQYTCRVYQDKATTQMQVFDIDTTKHYFLSLDGTHLGKIKTSLLPNLNTF